MDMGFTEFIKVYGPLAIGWVIAGYLGKFILDRYQSDIDSRVSLSQAIHNLTQVIKSNHGDD